MKIRFLASFAMAAAVALTSLSAEAGYVLSNGSFYVDGAINQSPGPNPPAEGIITLGISPASTAFTNQLGGTAFAPGNTIRTVGAALWTEARTPLTFGPSFPDGTTPLAFVFAVEGVITQPGVAFHSGGSVFITAVDGLNFDPTDPSTWSFGDAIAKFNMAPQGNIIDGETAGLVSKSGSVQTIASAVNVQAVANIPGSPGSTGSFIFLEDPSFVPTGNTFGLGSFVGDEFLFDVEAPLGAPGISEGLNFLTTQAVESNPTVLTAAQLAILDSIVAASSGFSGSFFQLSPGDPGYLAGYEFAPTSPTSITSQGDIQTLFGATGQVVAMVVPEPSSVAAFAFGLIVAGAAGVSRRRRKLASK